MLIKGFRVPSPHHHHHQSNGDIPIHPKSKKLERDEDAALSHSETLQNSTRYSSLRSLADPDFKAVLYPVQNFCTCVDHPEIGLAVFVQDVAEQHGHPLLWGLRLPYYLLPPSYRRCSRGLRLGTTSERGSRDAVLLRESHHDSIRRRLAISLEADFFGILILANSTIVADVPVCNRVHHDFANPFRKVERG